MSYFSKMQVFLKEPGKLLSSLAARGLFNWLPDKAYLRLVFRSRIGTSLDLDNVQTYNEKLQWLKLHYRPQEQVRLADKVEVRRYVQARIGAEYLIPILGVYDKVEDIPWNYMPNRFVLKCSHASSANIVCVDKSKLNIPKTQSQLQRWMRRNWFWYGREWPYLGIKPRILAEEFLDDGHQTGLVDYKFFCFDGHPRVLFVATDRQSAQEETKFDFYDLDWNKLPIVNGHPNSSQVMEKPASFDEMLRIARELSRGFPHVRIDLYEVHGRVFFGEMTFYHYSGFTQFKPFKWDVIFGSWLKLPNAEREDKHYVR